MTRTLLQGSEAVADAAIAAGCRFFAGYPMLPFTELLEHMSRKLPSIGGACINADTEIEAINMALGASATGARAATGSCGQGIALMQEAVAEAALNELPLVIFNMARGQQDYFQATRGGGWGDYRTITYAPKDVPEAVEHTHLLFHLADLHRTPVLMYGDYIIAHTHVGIAPVAADLGPLPPKDWALDGSMGGTGRARQIWTWDRGKPNTPGRGPDQHWKDVAAKYAALEQDEARWEQRLIDDAEAVIVSWGTTATVVDYVVDELRADGTRVGSFRPVTLWPFPGDAFAAAVAGANRVLVYELNAGQMLDDVRIHAPDRKAVRFIGSVSQDQTGMRQGDLLDAAVLRDRVLTALKEGS